jgi:hypothetical protein
VVAFLRGIPRGIGAAFDSRQLKILGPVLLVMALGAWFDAPKLDVVLWGILMLLALIAEELMKIREAVVATEEEDD